MTGKNDFPTADDLRADMLERDPQGRRLNPAGVDFEKLAEVIRTARQPEGWSAPLILPPSWRETSRSPMDGTTMYVNAARQLKVILSCTIETDERAWLHLSVSSTNRVKPRLPNWAELGECKRVFLLDREAYQVIPPKARYVNINERVLHLFALYDEKQSALPDFTRGTGSL